MARTLRAWAIDRGGKNSVRNVRYGPQTRLVRGMHYMRQAAQSYSGTAMFCVGKGTG